MKEITITMTFDPQLDSKREYEIECLATSNARYYYDCLCEIRKILIKYQCKKSTTEKEKKLIAQLQKECAEYFRGLKL